MAESGDGLLKQVALIGSYPPRRCGIATFTRDMYQAITGAMSGRGEAFTLAMNDVPEGYDYPEEVRVEVRESVIDDYSMASSFLNINLTDIVILQHEYGIYGGTWGRHILRTLRELRMPVVTTCHTVLLEPNDDQRAVMTEIARLSERMVVMSERAEDILVNIYDTPRDKIAHIPHGIPDVPFVDPNFYKDRFGVEGRKVLLTFGLLSPRKGLENVIEALPAIVKKYPQVTYVILGVTHPHVKKSSGEEYRLGLQRLADELGVKENVSFINRFVELEELCQCIGAADIYVTPYLNKEQITSGTLAYALGAGKAVVSTPYPHAEELLADGRGKLVPFSDSDAMASAILELLDDEVACSAMRRNAYQYCRGMVWSSVADQYLDLCRQIISERSTRPRPVSAFATEGSDAGGELPEIDLHHLKTITDDTGILQHSAYTTPNRDHGYTTDDNARALIVAGRAYNLGVGEDAFELLQTYLAFTMYAFNAEKGRFRNFMSYDRKWLEDTGSEDSHGRTLWALGETVAFTKDQSVTNLCARLFRDALGAVSGFVSSRAMAFSLVGIQDYLRSFGGDATARRMREDTAGTLFSLFEKNATDDWPWLEERATYANAIIPHALIMSGQWIPDSRMVETGLRALSWLLEIQTDGAGHLSVIGNDGWYPRGGTKANFDQQPIEAMTLVHACLEAFNVTQEKEWLTEARRCLDWFLGRNDLGTPVCDFRIGGCRDALHPNGLNENEGAESTLAWLLALTAMHGARSVTSPEENEKDG